MKHNLTGTKEYSIWKCMKQRCYNEKSKGYIHYGGRGIKMYIHWLNDPKAFVDYIKSLPDYGKENYTLDRINNDGDYEPGNLRYASRILQSVNRRTFINNISGYNDICFIEQTTKYRCRISINKKRIHLGYYDTIEQAVQVRNQYIVDNNLPHKLQ